MKRVDALLAEASDPRNNRAGEKYRDAAVMDYCDAALASAAGGTSDGLRTEGATTRAQTRRQSAVEEVNLRPSR